MATGSESWLPRIKYLYMEAHPHTRDPVSGKSAVAVSVQRLLSANMTVVTNPDSHYEHLDAVEPSGEQARVRLPRVQPRGEGERLYGAVSEMEGGHGARVQAGAWVACVVKAVKIYELMLKF